MHEDENDIFRKSMHDVKPLNRKNDYHPVVKKTVVNPSLSLEHAQDLPVVYDYAISSEETFRRSGIQHHAMKKLRRGLYNRQTILDLHGANKDQARNLTLSFIANCAAHNHKSVLIIHGKGHKSLHKAVLKPLVNTWLRQLPAVLAFCPARPEDGGDGALYVLLKRGEYEE